MADLTPELLERLEYLAALKAGLDNESDETRDHVSGEMLRAVSLEFMDSATSLVAAAKERDQLRAEVERLRGLGIEAVKCLEMESPDDDATVVHLRAEIERKP